MIITAINVDPDSYMYLHTNTGTGRDSIILQFVESIDNEKMLDL